jgi:hypothetical protein
MNNSESNKYFLKKYLYGEYYRRMDYVKWRVNFSCTAETSVFRYSLHEIRF